MAERPFTLDRIFRLFLTVLTFGALVWTVGYVSDVLLPLAVGILLAYLLDPIVCWVQRGVPNRIAAVAVTLSGLSAVVVGLGVVLVPILSNEFSSAVDTAQSLLEPNSPLRQRLQSRIPARWTEAFWEILNSDDASSLLSNNAELGHATWNVVKATVPQLWGILDGAMSVVETLFQLMLVVVYLVFILIDFGSLTTHWKGYLPPAYRESVVAFLAELDLQLSRYFRGQFVIALCVGVLAALGFWFLGLKLGILLGLFLGALNMVPYLQIAGFVPAVLLAGMTALERDQSFFPYLLGLVIVIAAVQLVQDVFLTPKIMGSVTGLPPVLILFSVFFWGKLLGFLGLVLAIPLTCIGLAYYRRFLGVTPAEATGTA